MGTTSKLDLYRLHRADYAAPRKPMLLEIKPANYLAIEGRGEPGADLFQVKLGALYQVAFTMKMAKKFAGQDYAVCKLEGLWWQETLESDPPQEQRAKWKWKLIIRVPDFIQQRDLRETMEKLKAKGKASEVEEVRLETLRERQCVQLLHVGAYEEEARSIERMKEFARENGLSFRGLHHEIYLSDPRRVAPARLRTILRHPVG
jgi:hypothetical protein